MHACIFTFEGLSLLSIMNLAALSFKLQESWMHGVCLAIKSMTFIAIFFDEEKISIFEN